VQRVSSARVEVDGRVVGEIGVGLLCLVAVHREDSEANVTKMAEKLVNLRIFNDAEGKMNLSLTDLRAAGVDGGLLIVSNFTVYGDASKSRRPSFTSSAGFEEGKRLIDLLVEVLAKATPNVACGEFGADMKVSLTNDGPVTLVVET